MTRSPLLPIFLTVFVDVLGLTLMLPLLPFYAEHFGASPQMATTLIASYAVCQLVSGPILGRLSDRIGRKPVLLASQMGTLAGFLIIGGANSLWLLFVGRMIDGLTAGNLSIAQAYISDVTRPSERTRSFALIGIAFGSGFLFGPMISGELSHRFGFAAPAYMAAALSLLSVILSATLLPDQATLEKIKAERAAEEGLAPAPPAGQRNLALGRFLTRPLARRRLLQFFAFTTSFAVLTGGLGLYLERQFHFGPRETGWVYGVSGFVGAVIQGGAIKRLVQRLGEPRLALFGFVSMAITYPFLGLIGDSYTKLFILVVLSSFGVAVVRPCLTTLITKSVSREEQGAALGTSQSLTSISQIVGPSMAGFFIQHHQLGAYGAAAGVFAIVGAVLSMQPEPTVDVVGSL
ncbi:multidrug-efflux transporter [Minicystis rosea]|nr:multidrug-efflux transporter [Minicystis rosea]